jgi:HSP20 family protein
MGGMKMSLLPRETFFRDIFEDLFDLPVLKTADVMRSDVYEKNGNYIIEIDIPGFQKEDINIDYTKGYLNISAIREETKEEEKNYIRRERFLGQYKRSFYIGEIDESQVKANFENGILKVSFPKKQLETESKKLIEIE